MKNDRFVLFRNIIVSFCITWIILILVIVLLLKDITYLGAEQIFFVLVSILIYIIVYLPKSISKLKILIKYNKNQINEIEKIKSTIDKDNLLGDICFLEDYLIMIKKNYFEIIRYDDILWFFREIYYSKRGTKSQKYNFWLGFKNYGDFVLITKDKKIHKLGYVGDKQKFKARILEKNPDILFGRTGAVIKKVRQLYKLNINVIDFKIIIKNYFVFLSILFIFYWIYWLVF